MLNEKNEIGRQFKICVGDSLVSVYFSQEESEDIKRKIRDILTSAYEQRVQNVFSPTELTDKLEYTN